MTRRDRPTRLRRCGAALWAAAALGGCGGGDGADADDERRSEASVLISQAGKTTLAKATARQYLDFHTEPARKVAFTMDGVVDIGADDSRGTIRYEAFEGVDPGTEVEIITFDDIDYFRQGGEESWLKTETTEEDAIANSSDVPDGLRNLGAVTNDARARGRESIRGVPTTRYTATVDAERIPDTLPPEQRDTARRKLQVLKEPELPVQVWIDDAGVIRRLSYEFDLDNLRAPSAGEERMVATIDLFDFGVDARVQAPPPEQTVEE